MIAIEADPAPTASPGDRVRVWKATDEGAESVATAELRATTGDIATLATDTRRLGAIDQAEVYHLVTVAATKQPEKEFAALLRTANETMGSTTIGATSPLRGAPVGALEPVVAAAKPADRPIDTLPPRNRIIEAGDAIYAIGRPDQLRKLDALAEAGSVDRTTGNAAIEKSVR